jgi:hypothetical protein
MPHHSTVSVTIFFIHINVRDEALLPLSSVVARKMSLSSALVASAIGALVGSPVIEYDDYCRDSAQGLQALDMKAFHKSSLVAPTPTPTPIVQRHLPPLLGSSSRQQSSFQIYVETLTGKTTTLDATS